MNAVKIGAGVALTVLVLVCEGLAETIRKDYGGRPFVTQKAPDLKFEVRKAPLKNGVDYPFEEQTALGVVLFERFPEFTVSDRRLHTDGPWYDSDKANLHFTRGFETVGTLPNFRLDDAPASTRRLHQARKWSLLTDPIWYRNSKWLAEELARKDPDDPRIPALRRLCDDRTMVADRDAYLELGRHMWRTERTPVDLKNEGFRYAMIDIETTEGWEAQRDCLGWLYQGLIEAATADGQLLIPVTYGQWTFSVGAVYESMREGGTGDPEYLKPEKDFLAAPDPTLVAVDTMGGSISMDGYLQAIWGYEPFYERRKDGKLLLKNGEAVFSDLRKTTLYGLEVPLEPNEAEHCLSDLYRQATRLYLMYYRMAGEYPSHSEMRKPFLRNSRVGAWSRYTNEGVQGIESNDRPLPGWEIEMLSGMYLMLADDIVYWSSDFNNPPGRPGADYTKTWKYNAQGVVEYAIKAAHRYSVFDPIHGGPFKWCWFNLPTVNQNKTDGDRYYQKPLLFGKLRTYKDKPWIELFAAWPALDGESAEFTLWLDKKGQKSKPFTFEVANGRSYFYDAWELPGGFKNLEGQDVKIRVKDPTGVTRTWCGDWRKNGK